MTARVLHIPSHMTYVQALGDSYTPAGSTAESLRIGELLATPQWDLDVVHLHSFELVTLEELIRLRQRATREGVAMVVTIHDLVPNIESSTEDFQSKVAYVATVADHVFTLTDQAAAEITRLAPGTKTPEVTPHGAAICVDAIPPAPVVGDGGLAVFGAFRPYRELGTLVRAWQRLGAARPHLRVLLRSVTAADHERDGDLLDLLKTIARADTRLSLTVAHAMLSDDQLLDWLVGASALVLPYSHITHSGQLELARDIGLPVIAPDVATVRDQLTSGPCPDLPIVWFRPEALTLDAFPTALRHAIDLAGDGSNRYATRHGNRQAEVRAARMAERKAINTRHGEVYSHLEASTAERV